MFDDRMFARVLRQECEDELEKRRLIREAERVRAAEESEGQKLAQAVQPQSQRHSGPTRRAA